MVSELLMHTQATERFEAVYPLLKEVALAGAPGSKAMKQVTQQIFTSALRLAGEGNPVLAKAAAGIAVWAVTENVDCCKHWDNLYKENLEASVAVLKRLVEEWKEHSLKLSSSPSSTVTLNRTIKSFRLKVMMPPTLIELNRYHLLTWSFDVLFRTRKASVKEEAMVLFTEKLISSAK